MTFAWLNNEFVDESSAAVSVRDTGLLHAAGVFTTMRSYGGVVFRLDDHLARLRASCEAFQIPLLYKDDVLTAAATELLRRNELRDARLRLTVTRGSAQQHPLHGLQLRPTVLLTASEIDPYPQEYYQRGMTVVLLDEQKLNPYDAQAGHKTLNYLSRLMALRSANQRQAGEALWFNVHNYLQSGCITNVFLVKNGVLHTPPTQQDLRDPAVRETTPYPRSNVLPGIARSVVIELARADAIDVRTRGIDVDDVLSADELFVTNSIMGVMPVTRVERHAVGTERPGEITTRLMAGYERHVVSECGGAS